MKNNKTPKRRTFFLAAAGVVVGTLIAGSLSAPASAQDGTSASSTSEVVGTLEEIADVGGQARQKINEFIGETAPVIDGVAISDSATATLPSGEDNSVRLTDSDSQSILTVNLPGAKVIDSQGSSVVLDGGNDGESFVVHGTAMGGVQILNVANSPVEEHSFDFEVSTPEGTQWVVAESGAVELRDADGLVQAVVDTPWAVDASGKSLPTRFSVEGGKITQIVDTRDAAFPVVADPDLWWVIGSSALCAAEIAGLAMGAAKVIQAFAKADKIVKSVKSAVSAYNALGGKMDKVVNLVKKYVRNKTSLTKAQINALEKFIREVGKFVFNVVGLGTCYALATSW